MIDRFLRSLSSWLSHAAAVVSEPGFKQTRTAKRIAVALGLLVTAMLLWLVYGVLHAWAALEPATVAQGERLLFALAALNRVVAALVLIPLGLFLAWALFQVFDRTKLAEHLMTWRPKDTEASEAAKTRNSGTIFAALLLGIFVVLAQVVR